MYCRLAIRCIALFVGDSRILCRDFVLCFLPNPFLSNLICSYPVAGTFCIPNKCQMITVAHSELTRLGQSDCLCLPLF